MKKNQWLIWVGLGLVAWYWWKQKTKSNKLVQLPSSGFSTTTSGGYAESAASQAKNIVADVVDQTTFLPDLSTDRDLYDQDQKSCK